MTSKLSIVLLLIVGLSGALASIETSKPVPVTHRNSGPRYDIDDVERTRLTPGGGDNDNNQQQPPPSPSSSMNGDDNGPSIGHVSIRRIFLVPMMPGPVHPPDSLWSQGSSSAAAERNHEPQDGLEREQPDRLRRIHLKPLFGGSSDPDHSLSSENHHASPFLPTPFHHLFGQDSASRSPNEPPKGLSSFGPDQMPSSPEEQAARDRFQSAVLDPIQMMIEMMQQALHQAQPKPDESTIGSDLNKEASSGTKPEQEDKNDKPFTGLNKSLKPLNETKEDIIEIDGKKYIRKTVINRHVGENIIFMTKRLIFVPLNETDSSTTTTTVSTTEQAPTTTTSQPILNETPSTTTTELPKKIEEPTTTVPISSTSSEPTSTVENKPDESSIVKDDKDKLPEESSTKKDIEELTTGAPTTSKPAESISP